MATDPTINGKTFAQASSGITDRAQLGQIATQYQNANAPGAPTVPNPAITSDKLAPNVPLKLPQPTTPTFGGVAGAADALVTQTKTADQQALDTLKQNSDTSLKDLLQATLDQGNVSSSVDRTAQNAAKQQSDLYTSQLEQEQLANRRAVESINNNAGITTAAQRDAEAADVNRKSLSKQADIAILQTAANRNYDTAASIADRQVALKLEQGTARVNALKYFYENNKDAFTKADDRAYQEKIKKEDAALKKQEDNLNDLKGLKLTLAKNGAPISALTSVDQSKDLAEALNNPKISQYFTSPADKLDLQLKRLQIAKASNDLKTTSGGGVLTVDQAIKLGVPLGTTYAQYNALQGKTPSLNPTQQNALDSAQRLLTKFNEGSTGLGGNIPVGIASIGFKLPGSNRADFKVNLDNLKGLLALDAAKLLKGQGALSDSERKLLADSATQLNAKQSPELFKTTLETMINLFQKATPDYQYAEAAANLATQADINGSNADTYASSLNQ